MLRESATDLVDHLTKAVPSWHNSHESGERDYESMDDRGTRLTVDGEMPA